MYRKQDAACLDPAFVTLGFKFRDAHANQSSSEAANGSAENLGDLGRPLEDEAQRRSALLPGARDL